jgi:hypothetical protein
VLADGVAWAVPTEAKLLKNIAGSASTAMVRIQIIVLGRHLDLIDFTLFSLLETVETTQSS